MMRDMGTDLPRTASDHGDHILHWQGGGEALSLHLTPERALFWPARQTLFVADVHLGKAAVFRARGLPVPRGTTAATLERLTHVLQRTGARRLVVLGDFLHARESHAPGTMAVLHAWRAAHADLECTVVQGNHDRHAGALSADLRFGAIDTPYAAPGLIGVHDAAATPAGSEGTLVLCGHEHPAVVLRDKVDQIRLRCYALRGHVLTLPAFGGFTGGQVVDLETARVFAVTDKVTPV